MNGRRSGQPSKEREPTSAEPAVLFDQLLRRYRLAAGLTQEALAERAGVGARSVQALERSEGRPRRETAHRLADALQLAGTERAAFVACAGPSPRQRADRTAAVPFDRSRVRLVSALPAPNTVPVPLTSFVGRDREIADVIRLLRTARILTLTGAAGTGKTRLTVQVAAQLRNGFAGGVVFVPLAHIGEAALVVPAIAAAVGVEQGGGPTLLHALLAYLRDKSMLLLLDNFEHLVDAAPRLVELLASSPSLRVLVTSRTALRVTGEQEYSVPPLPVPDGVACDTDAQHAVTLFVQRAQAVKPDFALTAENAPHVAEICRQLDGLPLAIELAAARCKLLTPELLLARLARRLDVLVGGPRDLAQRQQTMRGAIAWSHDLLDPCEQELFRRLAIFRGGWTLDAAEAVCSDHCGDVLDTLGSLLDKSLVGVREAQPGVQRHGMLETLREYAGEQLQQHGEMAALAERHAGYYLRLAQHRSPCPAQVPNQQWLSTMSLEQENVRAALQWALERGDIEMATQLAMHLVTFWSKRGELSEARDLLERLRALDEHLLSPQLQVQSLASLAAAVWHQGDAVRGRALLEQCLTLTRDCATPGIQNWALDVLGYIALVHGAYDLVTQIQHEDLALADRAGAGIPTERALTRLGDVARARGEAVQLRRYCEESLALSRAHGDRAMEGYALNNLAYAALLEHELQQALSLFTASIAVFRDMEFLPGVAEVLANIGRVTHAQGKIDEAQDAWTESLRLMSTAGPDSVVPDVLEELAYVAAEQGQPERAARLLGASQTLRDARCLARWPVNQPRHERIVQDVRERLGDDAFEQVRRAGGAMPLNEVVAFARTPLARV